MEIVSFCDNYIKENSFSTKINKLVKENSNVLDLNKLFLKLVN